MPVNEQITDSVTQVNTKVVGETPAMAMGNLMLSTSQALSNAAHNATAAQQQALGVRRPVLPQRPRADPQLLLAALAHHRCRGVCVSRFTTYYVFSLVSGCNQYFGDEN